MSSVSVTGEGMHAPALHAASLIGLYSITTQQDGPEILK
jgi:hypothetical protein